MSLELISTNELVEELLSRCDAGLVYLTYDLTEGLQKDVAKWHGSPLVLAGMAANLQLVVLDCYNEASEEEDEDE